VAVWLYIAGIGTPQRGLPARLYSVLLLLRLAAMLFLLVQVWRAARSRTPLAPEPVDLQQDDVLYEDEVDPLAGPMAGAPDQVLVRLR
jgi:hypothetical protein